MYDNSLIVFTSDHGEELGERSKMGWHSHALWDEQIRVPLIIKFPNGEFAGTRVAPQVRSIDILPTTLDSPEQETVIVEKPEKSGPYGGKGVGEAPTVPVTPAVANAIHDAVGLRFIRLPITPEDIVAGLEGGER